MIRHGVIRFDSEDNLRNISVRLPRDMGAAFYAYAHKQVDSSATDIANIDINQQVYFTDNDRMANLLANYLASKFPNYKFCTFAIDTVHQSQPGPVNVGRFTDEGFIPV